MRTHPWRLLWILGCLTLAGGAARAADLPGTGADAGRTVVYRDTWGVPHIYAPTIEAGLYAQGWAQAEDRPHELLKNLLRALGEAASVDGPGAVSYDLVARVWDHPGTAKRLADRVSPEVRGHLRAFGQGIRDYYAAHPEDVPEWWGDREIDEHMLVAFGRLFLYAWSIEQTFADLKRAGIEPGLGTYHHGSNEWAVSPARSAEGAAIILIDPHLSWWNMSRFWEFRIHAGALNGSGFTLPAFPYIGLGHTDHVAWAMTTGGPDTADVYELTLNAEDPSKYLYDGEWRQMTKREIAITIKGVPEPQTFTIWDSHYGPVIAANDGKAYAAKTAYADTVRVADIWYKINTAQDFRDVRDAMAVGELYPQNTLVADTSGNIYYQRTGRVPRRPAGFDWSRPVNGSTSATEWLGIHPSSDHVQLLNPPQGYMQNCNIPPDAMVPDSPLTLDKYPDYLYSDQIYGPRNGWTNFRGARAVQLLSQDDAVTVDAAKRYALDVHPYGTERWLAALKEADAKLGAPLRAANPDYAAGIDDLLAWDGEMRRDSSGALKYYYWRMQLLETHGEDTMAKWAGPLDDLLAPIGKPAGHVQLGPEELQAAVAAVGPAMATLKADFGSLDAVFGDKFRVGRAGVSWPVGGGSMPEVGMRALRSVGYSTEGDDHTRLGHSGQTSTQVVVMSEPVQSWTYVPIGQSDRPESPHFRDQAEQLFSERRLKPTWYQPEDLAEHIATRTVLEGAPSP